ncbi:J domain-containing protein [Ketobacter sp.]|uniref:J domain-containing protein n=1 Tax=Ketobacter sp. TaxID=2083498 RepID=UPI000F18F7AE|nr:J domain-containing protein [Ketobacter sp.]RLU00445.1 MAG: J domain-containing protein [Ketobacter sp.]
MHDNRAAAEPSWVIWNLTLGLRDIVFIGEVETRACGRQAWLEEPYDMVGPFSLDDLEASGCIRFEACVVMSLQRWQREQAELRRQARINRHEYQERVAEAFARFNTRRGHQQQTGQPQQKHSSLSRDKQHRALLGLPVEGELAITQIKLAYRRLAQKAHPDVGGSQQRFVEITEARDGLLAQARR